MKGILLAIQFFTIIPIHKELPMERRQITVMYAALPFVGALVGLGMIVSFWISGWLGFGPALTSVLLLITAIGLTGGLHLDGAADTSDAYFSYRDQARRHEILDDPRIGAFGTLGLLILVLLKGALLYEWLTASPERLYLLIVIPFLARSLMTLYFVSVKPAKASGMAFFFLRKLNRRPLILWSVVVSAAALAGVGYLETSFTVPLALAAVMLISFVAYRSWTIRNFGGVTGDLSGAFIEGMEVVLWLAMLSLL